MFLIYVVIVIRVAILRFSCVCTCFMLKTLKIQNNEKSIAEKSVFLMKRVLTHTNLEIATLRPNTT